MKRFQFLASFLLLSAALAFTACSGGNGGASKQTSNPWNNQSNSRTAQTAPKNLDVPQSQLRPSSISDDSNDMSAQNSDYAAPIADSTPLPPVKIGVLLPLSGNNAALGQAMLNAAQMALFEVGHNSFELIPRDTQGTAAGAQSAAREVLAEGAQLVLGPVFSDSVRAAKSITRAAGVNMVAFSTDWALADNTTYMMGFLPFDQVARITSYAAGNGIRNVGVFAPSSDYGDAVINAYNSVSYKSGINTAQMKRFSANAPLDPAVRSFSGMAPGQSAPLQAIFMPVGGAQASQISALATQNGLPNDQVKRLGTGLWEDDSLARDPNMNGAWFAAPSPNLRKGFERRYFETYGESAPRLTTLAYDATALAAVLARNGLQNGGARPSFDSAAIQNANGFAGIDGIFRFRDGGLVERGLAVLEFRNGQTRILDDAPKTFQQQGM